MLPRRLLLVGEGNFSFAASLIDGLDPSVSVTATGFQHRAALEGDPVALENLKRLRERGSKSQPAPRARPERKGVARAGNSRAPPGGAQADARVCSGLGWAALLATQPCIEWWCLSRFTDLKTSFGLYFTPLNLARCRSAFWCGLYPAVTCLASRR
jgi:hypothetical protein